MRKLGSFILGAAIGDCADACRSRPVLADQGSGRGGQWGGAIDGRQAYFGINDFNLPTAGGIVALHIGEAA